MTLWQAGGVRVCVLGGGGREHALAWAADKFGHAVVVVPGNAGNPWSSPDEPMDADLYVLGTDDAVCSGQGDRLREAGHLVFGPNADGGQLASEGYPTAPRVGDPIEGLSAAQSLPEVMIFSAGVGPGNTTSGGRVLNVTGIGDDLTHARNRAYAAVDMIHWPGMHYRRDIALSALS